MNFRTYTNYVYLVKLYLFFNETLNYKLLTEIIVKVSRKLISHNIRRKLTNEPLFEF